MERSNGLKSHVPFWEQLKVLMQGAEHWENLHQGGML